ncbi:MAG TPA: DUF6596 domain-containing protein [Devosiaceae bacterium]
MTEAAATAARAAERAARESYGRLLAFLAARTRDVAGAEDALAEAFAAALASWPVDGVPDNPSAWLLTVARRRQTDHLRRGRTRRSALDHLRLVAEELEAAASDPVAIPDRRLALMFACAHPGMPGDMRAPLILQTILGLTAVEIAAAFLIPPATMSQRLVRAKARIRDAGIPFRIPDRSELASRLDAVLGAIYAAYSRSWNEIGTAGASSLALEAIWLSRLVVSLLPKEPEAKGLLALMLHAEARKPARRDPSGAFVPLDRQDTALWNLPLFEEAEAILREANASGPTGRYQIEAAIQSAHTIGRLAGETNWQAIVALYDHLAAITGSPVVILNRAVALANIAGPAAALKAVAAMRDDTRMKSYQPYWAALAHLNAETGHIAEAHEAMTIAIGLSSDPAVAQYLRNRLDALPGSGC